MRFPTSDLPHHRETQKLTPLTKLPRTADQLLRRAPESYRPRRAADNARGRCSPARLCVHSQDSLLYDIDSAHGTGHANQPRNIYPGPGTLRRRRCVLCPDAIDVALSRHS